MSDAAVPRGRSPSHDPEPSVRVAVQNTAAVEMLEKLTSPVGVVAPVLDVDATAAEKVVVVAPTPEWRTALPVTEVGCLETVTPSDPGTAAASNDDTVVVIVASPEEALAR